MVKNNQWLIYLKLFEIFNLKRNEKLNSSSFCDKTVILCHSQANKAYCCCCRAIREGAVSKKFFWALRPLVWSKNNGEARPPGPLSWVRHCSLWFSSLTANWWMRTTWWHWIKGYSPLTSSMRGRHSTGCSHNDIKTGCPFPRDRKAWSVLQNVGPGWMGWVPVISASGTVFSGFLRCSISRNACRSFFIRQQ